MVHDFADTVDAGFNHVPYSRSGGSGQVSDIADQRHELVVQAQRLNRNRADSHRAERNRKRSGNRCRCTTHCRCDTSEFEAGCSERNSKMPA